MLFVKYTTCVDMIRDSMLYTNSIVQFEVIYEIENTKLLTKGKKKERNVQYIGNFGKNVGATGTECQKGFMLTAVAREV